MAIEAGVSSVLHKYRTIFENLDEELLNCPKLYLICCEINHLNVLAHANYNLEKCSAVQSSATYTI